MDNVDIHSVFSELKSRVQEFDGAVVDKMAKERSSPFKILISTLISSRTKDEVTREASKRLFSQASSPEEMINLSKEEIQKLIYPAGFYKNKSKYILETSKKLVQEYDSKVPDTIEELVKLSGVGRKTANLVVTLAFEKPGICVDTHVHRITNRWGYINTKNPKETEKVLREKLPRKYWIPINNILVTYGQNICTPISPHCSKCTIQSFCEQIGVETKR